MARRLSKRLLPVLALAIAGTLMAAPGAFSFSGGITAENAGVPDFEPYGCTACHGEKHKFMSLDGGNVRVNVTDDATGEPLNGPYDGHTTYTINITLHEQVGADIGADGNHAGFNLRVSEGTLTEVKGISKVSADGTQATHDGADRTQWTVGWTPPEHGAVAFRLFVNDVDGNNAPNEADEVYQVGFWFPDAEGAVVGAAAEEEHVEFGISLQQYWIGLIGLFGMILVMLAGYVYLKYVNPHNSGPKDR